MQRFTWCYPNNGHPSRHNVAEAKAHHDISCTVTLPVLWRLWLIALYCCKVCNMMLRCLSSLHRAELNTFSTKKKKRRYEWNRNNVWPANMTVIIALHFRNQSLIITALIHPASSAITPFCAPFTHQTMSEQSAKSRTETLQTVPFKIQTHARRGCGYITSVVTAAS